LGIVGAVWDEISGRIAEDRNDVLLDSIALPCVCVTLCSDHRPITYMNTALLLVSCREDGHTEHIWLNGTSNMILCLHMDKTGHDHLVNYLSGNTNTLSFASGYRIENKIGQISRVDIDRIAALMVT